MTEFISVLVPENDEKRKKYFKNWTIVTLGLDFCSISIDNDFKNKI